MVYDSYKRYIWPYVKLGFNTDQKWLKLKISQQLQVEVSHTEFQ
jgi:hypothetical protein